MQESSTIDFQQGSEHGFASFELIYIEIGIFYRSYQIKGTVTQITVNTLEDISLSDLPSFMSSDIVEDLIFFVKHLFHQKKMRKSFNNDNKFEVPQKHPIQSLWLSRKQGWWNLNNENALIIVRTVFVVTRLKKVLVLVV